MWDALYMIAEPNTSGILNLLLTALKLWQLPHVQLTSGIICHPYCHHLNFNSFVSFFSVWCWGQIEGLKHIC